MAGRARAAFAGQDPGALPMAGSVAALAALWRCGRKGFTSAAPARGKLSRRPAVAREEIRGAERLPHEDGRGTADRAVEARGKALVVGFQFTVAPVCLTTLPHLSNSARMSLVSS